MYLKRRSSVIRTILPFGKMITTIRMIMVSSGVRWICSTHWTAGS